MPLVSTRRPFILRRPVSLVTPVTWDSAHIGSSIVLSNFNRTLTAGVFSGSRSTTSQSSGKWYVEIAEQLTHVYNYTGFAQSDWALDYPGNSDHSFTLCQGGNNYLSAMISGSGVAAGSGTWGSGHFPSTNDIDMLAIDITNGLAWAGVNGAWLGNQNPSAGTNPAVTFTPGGTWFIAGAQYTNVSDFNTTLNATTTYAPPAGFSIYA